MAKLPKWATWTPQQNNAGNVPEEEDFKNYAQNYIKNNPNDANFNSLRYWNTQKSLQEGDTDIPSTYISDTSQEDAINDAKYIAMRTSMDDINYKPVVKQSDFKPLVNPLTKLANGQPVNSVDKTLITQPADSLYNGFGTVISPKNINLDSKSDSDLQKQIYDEQQKFIKAKIETPKSDVEVKAGKKNVFDYLFGAMPAVFWNTALTGVASNLADDNPKTGVISALKNTAEEANLFRSDKASEGGMRGTQQVIENMGNSKYAPERAIGQDIENSAGVSLLKAIANTGVKPFDIGSSKNIKNLPEQFKDPRAIANLLASPSSMIGLTPSSALTVAASLKGASNDKANALYNSLQPDYIANNKNPELANSIEGVGNFVKGLTGDVITDPGSYIGGTGELAQGLLKGSKVFGGLKGSGGIEEALNVITKQNAEKNLGEKMINKTNLMNDPSVAEELAKILKRAPTTEELSAHVDGINDLLSKQQSVENMAQANSLLSKVEKKFHLVDHNYQGVTFGGKTIIPKEKIGALGDTVLGKALGTAIYATNPIKGVWNAGKDLNIANKLSKGNVIPNSIKLGMRNSQDIGKPQDILRTMHDIPSEALKTQASEDYGKSQNWIKNSKIYQAVKNTKFLNKLASPKEQMDRQISDLIESPEFDNYVRVPFTKAGEDNQALKDTVEFLNNKRSALQEQVDSIADVIDTKIKDGVSSKDILPLRKQYNNYKTIIDYVDSMPKVFSENLGENLDKVGFDATKYADKLPKEILDNPMASGSMSFEDLKSKLISNGLSEEEANDAATKLKGASDQTIKSIRLKYDGLINYYTGSHTKSVDDIIASGNDIQKEDANIRKINTPQQEAAIDTIKEPTSPVEPLKAVSEPITPPVTKMPTKELTEDLMDSINRGDYNNSTMPDDVTKFLGSDDMGYATPKINTLSKKANELSVKELQSHLDLLNNKVKTLKGKPLEDIQNDIKKLDKYVQYRTQFEGFNNAVKDIKDNSKALQLKQRETLNTKEVIEYKRIKAQIESNNVKLESLKINKTNTDNYKEMLEHHVGEDKRLHLREQQLLSSNNVKAYKDILDQTRFNDSQMTYAMLLNSKANINGMINDVVSHARKPFIDKMADDGAKSITLDKGKSQLEYEYSKILNMKRMYSMYDVIKEHYQPLIEKSGRGFDEKAFDKLVSNWKYQKMYTEYQKFNNKDFGSMMNHLEAQAYGGAKAQYVNLSNSDNKAEAIVKYIKSKGKLSQDEAMSAFEGLKKNESVDEIFDRLKGDKFVVKQNASIPYYKEMYKEVHDFAINNIDPSTGEKVTGADYERVKQDLLRKWDKNFTSASEEAADASVRGQSNQRLGTSLNEMQNANNVDKSFDRAGLNKAKGAGTPAVANAELSKPEQAMVNFIKIKYPEFDEEALKSVNLPKDNPDSFYNTTQRAQYGRQSRIEEFKDFAKGKHTKAEYDDKYKELFSNNPGVKAAKEETSNVTNPIKRLVDKSELKNKIMSVAKDTPTEDKTASEVASDSELDNFLSNLLKVSKDGGSSESIDADSFARKMKNIGDKRKQAVDDLGKDAPYIDTDINSMSGGYSDNIKKAIEDRYNNNDYGYADDSPQSFDDFLEDYDKATGSPSKAEQEVTAQKLEPEAEQPKKEIKYPKGYENTYHSLETTAMFKNMDFSYNDRLKEIEPYMSTKEVQDLYDLWGKDEWMMSDALKAQKHSVGRILDYRADNGIVDAPMSTPIAEQPKIANEIDNIINKPEANPINKFTKIPRESDTSTQLMHDFNMNGNRFAISNEVNKNNAGKFANAYTALADSNPISKLTRLSKASLMHGDLPKMYQDEQGNLSSPKAMLSPSESQTRFGITVSDKAGAKSYDKILGHELSHIPAYFDKSANTRAFGTISKEIKGMSDESYSGLLDAIDKAYKGTRAMNKEKGLVSAYVDKINNASDGMGLKDLADNKELVRREQVADFGGLLLSGNPELSNKIKETMPKSVDSYYKLIAKTPYDKVNELVPKQIPLREEMITRTTRLKTILDSKTYKDYQNAFDEWDRVDTALKSNPDELAGKLIDLCNNEQYNVVVNKPIDRLAGESDNIKEFSNTLQSYFKGIGLDEKLFTPQEWEDNAKDFKKYMYHSVNPELNEGNSYTTKLFENGYVAPENKSGWDTREAQGTIKNLNAWWEKSMMPKLKELPEYADKEVPSYLFDNLASRVYLRRALNSSRFMFQKNMIDEYTNLFGEALKPSGEWNKPYADYISAKMKTADMVLFTKNNRYTEIALDKNAVKRGISSEDEFMQNIMESKLDKPFNEISLDDVKSGVKLKVQNNEPLYMMPKEQFRRYLKSTEVEFSKSKNTVQKMYDWTRSLWKLKATSINPSYHVNNMMGNAWNSMLGAGGTYFHPDVQYNAARIQAGTKEGTFLGKSYEQIRQLIRENGVDNSNSFTDNLADFSNQKASDILDTRTKGKKLLDAINPTKLQDFVPFKVGQTVGSNIEEQARVANFLAHLKNGKTPQEAGELTNKFLFDYNDLSQFEKTYMKKIFPFYTWMRKNIPLQLEQMAYNPKAYGNVAMARNEMNESFKGNKQDATLNPDYMDGAVSAGKGAYLNANLPYKDLAKFDPHNSDGNLGYDGIFKSIFGSVDPLLKLGIEEGMNKNTFFGSNIENYPGERKAAPNYLNNKPTSAVLNALGLGKRTDKSKAEMVDKKAVYALESLNPELKNLSNLAKLFNSDATEADQTKGYGVMSGVKVIKPDYDSLKRQAIYNYITKLKNKEKENKVMSK